MRSRWKASIGAIPSAAGDPKRQAGVLTALPIILQARWTNFFLGTCVRTLPNSPHE